MSDLQKVTDRLALALNRAIFVEDSSFYPLATSAQLGRVDTPRVQALLDRRPTQEQVRFFVDHGVARTLQPLRVPGDPGQGLLPRVVVPVTAGAQVLARIWLVDADPPVDADGIRRVLEAGEEMRPHLLGRVEATRRRVAAGGDLLQDIQNAGTVRRQNSFATLSDEYDLDDPAHARACLVSFRSRRTPSATSDDGGRPLPSDVLETFVDVLDVGGAVGYVRHNDLVALVASLATRSSSASTSIAISAAAHRTATLHGVVVHAIGIGGALETVDGFASSLAQADFAAKVAGRVRDLDGLGDWDELGDYRLFSAVEWSLEGVASIDPGVAILVAERRTPLAATLLAYLERESDVAETAAALNVHRTTLYYRIERAHELLGNEPTGRRRFAVHAALRLAHLAGLCSPARRS